MNGRIFSRLRGAAAAGCAAAGIVSAGCIVVVEDSRYESRLDGAEPAPRKTIGVTMDSVSRETASQLELDRDQVALITHVYTGTAAERAGLKRYDIITSIDGKNGASPSRVRAAIRDAADGAELKLGILRGGKPMEIAVVVREP